ncbi:hypothetical protein Hz2V057 [Helicoverpa zea nudivirus 2]|uniref:Uncharacterized protein n=1 Tax=Helicoverpa zea nudivirus 2 TaxID=1128424 RepID=G9I083_HZNV2|nr:orf57 gene product [Helicoverpa zea nudivirus 2]AEW69606.1 hypothetical protein Hz2V057 [Helicoverpa zea nudivirus 2]
MFNLLSINLLSINIQRIIHANSHFSSKPQTHQNHQTHQSHQASNQNSSMKDGSFISHRGCANVEFYDIVRV